MTHRERILAAISHRPLDRIPTDYWATGEFTKKIQTELGVEGMELWKRLDIDKIIGVEPVYNGPSLPQSNQPGVTIDYWGIESRPISYADGMGVYEEISRHPLSEYTTIDEIESHYTFPDAAWFDFSTIPDQIEQGAGYAIEGGYMAPFYYLTRIRGLQQSLMDLALNPELSHYLIDKLTDFFYDYHQRLFEAGKGKIDIAQVTDDFGTQSGLMISIEMFQTYFKKPYQRLIKLVKDHGIYVFHHDDGAIMDILPELKALGIDILNPIQWHLPGMDLKKMKQAVGDSICFHGGINNQQVLPFGSPEKVEREVLTCLSHLASDKTGYIVAPCHNIQAITPVKNVLRMYAIAHAYFN
jgi:uroporphyrinogen decarboxylase